MHRLALNVRRRLNKAPLWLPAMTSSRGCASTVPHCPMAQFAYDLPDERIAKHPSSPRGSSRLLVAIPAAQGADRLAELHYALDAPAFTLRARASRGNASKAALLDHQFSDLPSLLPEAHLVFNESQVVQARLGAGLAKNAAAVDEWRWHDPIEVLMLSPGDPTADPSSALFEPADGQSWRVMIRAGRRNVKCGTELRVYGRPDSHSELGSKVELRMAVESVVGDWLEEDQVDGVEAVVRLSTPGFTSPSPICGVGGDAGGSLGALLDSFGTTPLPPYLRRAATPDDVYSYQAVYSSPQRAGSVAAPTAGLHFTPEILAALTAAGTAQPLLLTHDSPPSTAHPCLVTQHPPLTTHRRAGVRTSKVALHVGAATFKPVTAANAAEHSMHSEAFSIGTDALEAIAQSVAEGRPIVPVSAASAP